MIGVFSILSNKLPDLIVILVSIMMACLVTYICSLEFVDRLTNRILFNPLSKLFIKKGQL